MAGLNLPFALIVCAALVYFFGQTHEMPIYWPTQLLGSLYPATSKTYHVTIKAGVFWINGLSRPNLTMKRGQTNFFNFESASTRGHPFYLSTENDNGGLDRYHGELTHHQGVQGSRATTGQLIFEVPNNPPYKEVYYHCGHHQHMGARISIR